IRRLKVLIICLRVPRLLGLRCWWLVVDGFRLWVVGFRLWVFGFWFSFLLKSLIFEFWLLALFILQHRLFSRPFYLFYILFPDGHCFFRDQSGFVQGVCYLFYPP